MTAEEMLKVIATKKEWEAYYAGKEEGYDDGYKQGFIDNIKFVNAQQMHKDHPDAFYAPTDDELDEIKEGSIVKVCDESERFWTIVHSVDGDNITAEINNVLFQGKPYSLDDVIKFKKENVYLIQ